MTHAAKSVLIFGIYVLLTSLAFLFYTDSIIGFFGATATNILLVKIIGMFLFFLSVYYIFAAIKNDIFFFKLTLITRYTAIIFLGSFVLLDYGKPIILIVWLPDLLSAIWTTIAMRK